jgi:hypothetical protein
MTDFIEGMRGNEALGGSEEGRVVEAAGTRFDEAGVNICMWKAYCDIGVLGKHLKLD